MSASVFFVALNLPGQLFSVWLVVKWSSAGREVGVFDPQLL